MGQWGVKSYENDEAGDALEAGFSRARGSEYDDLMDDANPLTLEQVHARLAGPETLSAALDALAEEAGGAFESWDEVLRLAYAGVVVRHHEFGVPIPDDIRERAILCLRDEAIDWEEATARRLRREGETRRLESAP